MAIGLVRAPDNEAACGAVAVAWLLLMKFGKKFDLQLSLVANCRAEKLDA